MANPNPSPNPRPRRHWAKHILEGPIVWILCMLYIAVTVSYG